MSDHNFILDHLPGDLGGVVVGAGRAVDSSHTFSLNLRLDREKYVIFIGGEREYRRVKAYIWCE